jgi:hypothetical protein
MSDEKSAAPVAAIAKVPIQLCVRRKEGFQLFEVDSKTGVATSTSELSPTAGPCIYSPCSRWMACLEGEQVSLWNAQVCFSVSSHNFVLFQSKLQIDCVSSDWRQSRRPGSSQHLWLRLLSARQLLGHL